MCKSGFAKLTVDYEDQRRQRIALSAINIVDYAINNTYQPHTRHSIGIDSLYSCILAATVQHSPQDSGSSGPWVLGSLVLGSLGTRPSKDRKGGSGKLAGVEVYTAPGMKAHFQLAFD